MGPWYPVLSFLRLYMWAAEAHGHTIIYYIIYSLRDRNGSCTSSSMGNVKDSRYTAMGYSFLPNSVGGFLGHSPSFGMALSCSDYSSFSRGPTRAHLVCLSHTAIVSDVLPKGAESVHLHKKDRMEASWPWAPLAPWGQGWVQLQDHHSAGDMLTFWLLASSQEKLLY